MFNMGKTQRLHDALNTATHETRAALNSNTARINNLEEQIKKLYEHLATVNTNVKGISDALQSSLKTILDVNGDQYKRIEALEAKIAELEAKPTRPARARKPKTEGVILTSDETDSER